MSVRPSFRHDFFSSLLLYFLSDLGLQFLKYHIKHSHLLYMFFIYLFIFTLQWRIHGSVCDAFINEPAHDKTYDKPCATSEDSDQPAHPRSLIRVFAYRMCLLKPPGYTKRDKREPLPYWMDVQADLRICWLHRSYCRFCRVLAY